MTTTDDKLLALRLLDLAASKRQDEERWLRGAYHDMAFSPGVMVAGCIMTEEQSAAQYSKGPLPRPPSRPPVRWSHGVKLGTRPATNHGSPHRKSPVRERYCGGVSCAPGLNGRCTACHDDN